MSISKLPAAANNSTATSITEALEQKEAQTASPLKPRASGSKDGSTAPRRSLEITVEPTQSHAGTSGGANTTILTSPPSIGPAVDPFNGALDARHLQQAAKDMAAAVPALPPNAGNSAQALHDKLMGRLTSIQRLAGGAELSAQAVVETGTTGMSGSELVAHLPLQERVDLGYKIRDHFAGAAEDAAKLAKTFQKNSPHKDVFKTLSGVFESLKRIHLTAVAPDHQDLYAQKETSNLNTACPGMGEQRSGALLLTSASGIGGGVPGVNVTGTLTGNQMFLVDDEKDTIHYSGMAANVAVKPGISDIATAGGRTGGTVSTGFYVGLTPQEIIKTKVIDKANGISTKVLAGSAGPKSRGTRLAVDVVKNTAKALVGRSYSPTAGAPIHLNDQKLAKGYTTTQLQMLATSLDTQIAKGSTGKTAETDTPPPTWSEIVASFYPSVPVLVQKQLSSGEELPQHSPVNRTAPPPLAIGARFATLRNPFAQAEAALLKENPEPTLPAATGATFSSKYDKLNTNVRSSKMAHELLDAGRLKDAAQVFTLVMDYDQVLHRTPDTPRLAQYAAVKQALGGKAVPGFQANDEFFGNNIPVQLETSIANPGVGKLETAEQQCERIAGLAASLAVGGEKLMAKPDKRTPAAIKTQLATVRRDAFRALNERIWNAQYDTSGQVTGGGYPGGAEAALAKPEKFLSESHDALSTALGLAGVHLFINKRQLARADVQTARNAMRSADTAYNTARDMLDKTFLPIRKDNIVRDHSSVSSSLVFNREQGTTMGTVSVGGGLNLALGKTEAGQVFTEQIKMQDNALKATVTAQIQTRLANRQVFDTRLGLYVETGLTIESGVPFTGELINKAVMKALEKAGLPPEEAKLQLKDVKDVLSQVLGTVVPRSGGLTLNLMYRQPPKADGRSMELEYIRLSKSATGGVNLDFAPSMPGTGNAAKANIVEIRRGTEFEVLGPGIGYMAMQHGTLTGEIDKARDALNRHRASLNEPANATFADAAAAVFLGDATAGVEANDFLRNRYFGKGDTLMKVLEKWLDFKHAQTNNQLPAPGEPMPNEFFRFFSLEPFVRTRKVAAEAEHHAPGSSAKGKDPFQPPPGLNQVTGLQLKDVHGVAHYDKNSAQWGNLKAQVAALDSPQARAQFFTQDNTGRVLFENFCNVISNVDATSMAMIHHAEKDRTNRPAGFGAVVRLE